MTVKLLMTWDIVPENEPEYFDFVISDFIPALQRIGLDPIEAWATVYGNYPQIQLALLAPGLPEVQRALNSSEWARLRETLFRLVKNYSQKIVSARNGFQF